MRASSFCQRGGCLVCVYACVCVHCVVEAGLYVTASTPVTTPDDEVVKAKELSGRAGLMFLRDGRAGRVVVRQRSGTWGSLNADLHAND